MFKTTLATALLVSASASQQQQQQTAAKAAGTLVLQAKHKYHQLHATQRANALNAAKEFKLASKGTSLKALGVSKTGRVGVAKTPLRSLRGKGGKGKGKGKGDEEEEEEEEEEGGDDDEVAMPASYLRMSNGYCSGADLLGDGNTLTEDMYLSHTQFKQGHCVNSVDTSGLAYSWNFDIMAEPFTVAEKTFAMHDCKDEYLTGSFDITSWFTAGGLVTTDGVCNDMGGGYGVSVSVSQNSLSMPAGFVGTAENGYVND